MYTGFLEMCHDACLILDPSVLHSVFIHALQQPLEHDKDPTRTAHLTYKEWIQALAGLAVHIIPDPFQQISHKVRII